MSSVRVIVDDNIGDDAIVKYTNATQWKVGGDSGEFNHTTHGMDAKGTGTVTFNFHGHSVQVVGSLYFLGWTVNYTYFIDSGAHVSTRLRETDLVQYHQTYLQEDVPDGEHSLTIALDDDGAPLIYDYFIYETTLERIVERKKPVVVLVDDSDTSSITYDGPWSLKENGERALNHTEHVVNAAGSTATLGFRGTYVAAFGTIGRAQSQAAFIIDNGTPAIFDNQQIAAGTFGYKLFEQHLEDGQHTLTIALRNDAEFPLDYILYSPSLSHFTPTSSANTPSNSVPNLAPDSPPSAPSGGGSTSGPSAAVIAGVVCGVLGAIFLIIVAVVMFRRAKRTRDRISFDDDANFGVPAQLNSVSPFQLSPWASTSNAAVSDAPMARSKPIGTTQAHPTRAVDGGVRDEEEVNPPEYQSNYPTMRTKNLPSL